VADRGATWSGVGGQLGALALHAAQHRVDQPMARAGLGQLHGLPHGGVVGDLQEQELEEPELQRRAHGRLELPLGAPRDDVVERESPLHRAEGQLLGQRAVARVEPLRLGVQRPVGVGALGEHPHEHAVGGEAGGADGGRVHWR
jgi:hypothetical protein